MTIINNPNNMTDIKNVDKYQQALNKYNLNITDAEVAEEVKKIVEKAAENNTDEVQFYPFGR